MAGDPLRGGGMACGVQPAGRPFALEVVPLKLHPFPFGLPSFVPSSLI